MFGIGEQLGEAPYRVLKESPCDRVMLGILVARRLDAETIELVDLRIRICEEDRASG
jgi:hypothetical protein